jgi:hypothetical protein
MKECNNSKMHISSNFLLSVCLLIMLHTFITRTITTLQHVATFHPTTLQMREKNKFFVAVKHKNILFTLLAISFGH